MAARKKVNIMELLDYIEQLPADSQIKKDLTEDKMIRIKRYLEELKYLDSVIRQLKADIKQNGAIELYKNGSQETRRANPALTAYMDAMKTYNQLLKQVSEILRNTEIYIQKLW